MPLLVIPYPEIDPILISIGPFAIRWYALAYVAGILLAWWLARRIAANDAWWGGTSPVRPQDVDDVIVWCALGIVLGGRIGYVLFYRPDFYLSHPFETFAVWEGGMSFHGGLVGVITAILVFAYRRKRSALELGDAGRSDLARIPRACRRRPGSLVDEPA